MDKYKTSYEYVNCHYNYVVFKRWFILYIINVFESPDYEECCAKCNELNNQSK